MLSSSTLVTTHYARMETLFTQSDKEEPVTKNSDVVVELPVVVATSPTPSPPPIIKPKNLIINGGDNHHVSLKSQLQSQLHQSQQAQIHQLQSPQNAQLVQDIQKVCHEKIAVPKTIQSVPPGKPNSHVRKMSTMVEEDSSDDLDNDGLNSALSVASSHPDNDSDSTYEERGRLLSADSTIANASKPCQQQSQQQHHHHNSHHNHHNNHHHHHNQSSRGGSGHRSSPLVVKRSGCNSLHDSTDSFHEKSPFNSRPRQHQQQQQQQQLCPTQKSLEYQQQQQQHRSSRGGSEHTTASAGASRHCSRHPSMRSLKSSSASDEHHCYPVNVSNRLVSQPN